MNRSVSRRAVLLGAAGATGLLAGCAGFGNTDDGDDTPSLTPVPLPEADVDPTSIAAVGSHVPVGSLAMVVTGVETVERAVILGREVDPGPDEVFRVVTVAFRNVSERYLALVVDRFDVAASGGYYDAVEPFDAFTAPAFGGWPFAPGERRTVRLHYAVPARTRGVELRGAFRLRTLPDETFERVPVVVVDLDSEASEPARLGGALTAPVHAPGDDVTAAGIRVHVQQVTSGVELSTWDPRTGHEFLGVNLAVENAGSGPVVVGVGTFGGLSVADARGVEYTTTRWFPGTVAGGHYYDAGRAVEPGETNTGTTVVEVPTGSQSLYLLWTPPANRWQAGTGVAVNRYVWQVR